MQYTDFSLESEGKKDMRSAELLYLNLFCMVVYVGEANTLK